ncbi:MAG TPA: TetR/AcrR family transcriptional regulator [Ilumatobacteraceae bacterium]
MVEALLELYAEGNLDPTTDEVAQRSGLSARSLFRYFEDVDDLCQAAITHHLASIGALSALPPPREEPLEDRVRTVAQMRVRLHHAIGAVGRVARVKAPFIPVLGNMLSDRRRDVRVFLGAWFAPELARMAPDVAATSLAAIDVVCSFEGMDLLAADYGMDPDAIQAVVERAITTILAGA